LIRRAIREHLLLIMLATVAVGGVAVALATTVSATYASTAGVLVKPLDGNALSPATLRSRQQVRIAMTTEAALVNSAPVVALANKTLPTKVAPGSAQVSGSVPPNSQIVDVQFTASTQKAARLGAQTFAQAFLRFRAAQSTTNHSLQIATLQRRSKTIQAKLARASVAGNTRTSQLTGELLKLQASLQKLTNAAGSPGIIFSPARRPAAGSGPSVAFWAVAGALAGLALGLLLAVWQERIDDRLRQSP
jgi:polysaccharide biosynthesis transport protein